MLAFFKFYGQLYDRALQIRSITGPFFFLKQTVIYGAPYFNMIWSVLVSTLFAYVLPVIVLEKKKFFQALFMNFKILRGGFVKTFVLVLLPSLLFIPVLLLRNMFDVEVFWPEVAVVTLTLSIIVTTLIDALVYTTLTIRYLWITRGE
jgi:hypothetical protein